jgi:hypothetical protein
MQALMACLHSGEDGVSLSFDVGPIGVESMLQTSFPKDLLAHRDLLGERSTHADGNHAQVDDDLHSASTDQSLSCESLPKERSTTRGGWDTGGMSRRAPEF